MQLTKSIMTILNPTTYSILNSNFFAFLNTPISLNKDMNDMFKLNIFYRLRYENVHLNVKKCIFQECIGQNGGCLQMSSCSLCLTESIFIDNEASTSAGALSALNSSNIFLNFSIFAHNNAKYTGAVMIDTSTEQTTVQTLGCNTSRNNAIEWTGAFRIDRNSCEIKYFHFDNNSAKFAGCIFEFLTLPCQRTMNQCIFTNNKGQHKSSCICYFHMKQSSHLEDCIFINNQSPSISIESTNIDLTLKKCCFTESFIQSFHDQYKSLSIHEDFVIYNATVADYIFTMKTIEIHLTENLPDMHMNDDTKGNYKDKLSPGEKQFLIDNE